ncbi:MAG: carbonate dehydratase [Spongiibacteraceae bacterium]|jgi:carbonic anhydrase|nr:carbonate dehydratase [Spongiibacteraceae bacterium]
METLDHLFANNRRWAEEIKAEDPQFFEKLSAQQHPEYLWIGCSDSRVPSNQIIGLMPGEVFVHRNVANIVIHTDLNCQSVLQFAVDVVKVKHIMVVGHYGCGGVRASLEDTEHGLIDNWLRALKDLYWAEQARFEGLTDEEERVNLLCELNVRAQVANVCHTSIVQNAWARGQSLQVHGWIYSVADGLLRDLGATIRGPEQIPPSYRICYTLPNGLPGHHAHEHDDNCGH